MHASTNILLVDDEPGFVNALAKRLVRRGMTVCTALDGGEALEQVRSRPLDVAVLALLMPGVDGVQLCKALRHEQPDLAIILLTGHGSVHEALRARDAGAFEFLSKPVALEKLWDTILRASGQKDAGA
ncbi:response regulator [Pseudodesulfovibrio sp.]|uniref:response regulator n=1 Tax=unclassified Pseudodesulfovibrio TaxID=2661612 RepID=UPI003AFFFA8D